MPEAEAPVVWGDFEVRFDRLLGRGGMGSVYEARQVSLDRNVAVKVLDTDRAPSEELAEGFLGKFQHEARALAQLNHPGIVTILQSGRADGKCWYAMELVDGETVDQRISGKGAFEPRDAARIAADVARALAAALAQGIIHRDVKPANIFLTADGRVKLGDFGLARSGAFKPTRFTELNAVAGTPEYASPEQAANGACDHRSDQYSLGAVLFEMVTERPPFGGANALETFFKHAHEPPPLPRKLNPAIPPPLESAILRCLEKDPARRFPDYESLVRELEAVRTAAREPVIQAPAARERPTLAIRTAFIAGALLVGFAIWGLTRVLPSGARPTRPPNPAPVVHEAPPPPPAPAPAPPPAEPSGPSAPDEIRALLADGKPIEALARMRAERLEISGVQDAARVEAWKACKRGDGDAMAAYLAVASDPALADELAGLRAPFSHPNTRAFERAIAALYRDRNHEPVALGEARAWKGYPGTAYSTWSATATGISIKDHGEATWISREFPVPRGFTLRFSFSPMGTSSHVGVSLSPVTPTKFRSFHLLRAGDRRRACLLARDGEKADARSEVEVTAAGTHEFSVVERDGKYGCFIDGTFVGWSLPPWSGDQVRVSVYHADVELIELQIAR